MLGGELAWRTWGRCPYSGGHHLRYHLGAGWGGAGARGPQGAQRGGGGPLLPGPGQASDTQTCTFLALSGSYCQVDGISVNGNEDPGPRREGSRRKQSINSFDGFCCTFWREKENIPLICFLN